MARQKLTLSKIRDLTLPDDKAQDFMWDTETPTLACRITRGPRPTTKNPSPKPTKAFVFQSLFGGKYLRITIGKCSDWSIDDARTEARRLQSVIDQGDDPRQIKAEKLACVERAKQEAEIRQATLGDIWPRYIAEASRHGRRKNSKPWGEHHIAAHERAIKESGALFPLLNVAIADLTEQRLKQWLEIETANRATVAALAYRMLRTCLNWLEEQAEFNGVVNAKAASAKTVTHVLPKPKAKNNVLRELQIKPWFDAILKLANPVIAAYLQVVLLTGRRREEILDLKWSDIDFKWATMTISDKVQGRVTLPFPPYCLALINNLPHNNQWVFSSPTAANGRLQEPRKSLERVIAEIGVAHTIHDLRRTYATFSATSCPAGIGAQLQGHTPKDVRGRHYENQSLDTLARWSAEMENHILKLAGR